jgi:hypothetical protein
VKPNLALALAFVYFLALLAWGLAFHHDSEITTRVCIQKSRNPELCTVDHLNFTAKDGQAEMLK